MRNKKFLKKPLALSIAAGLLIASLDSYVLLKTFVIPEVQAVVVKNTDTTVAQAMLQLIIPLQVVLLQRIRLWRILLQRVRQLPVIQRLQPKRL